MGIFFALKAFGKKCLRVLRVAKKPTGDEIKQSSKISAIGLLIIGLIGFAIAAAFTLLRLK